MKRLLIAIVILLLSSGCKLDPHTKYYKSPTIENIALSHDLTSVTANDDITVMADVTSPFGRGLVCVKYWVGNNTWGDTTPELRIVPKNQELQIKVEPTTEGEEVTWKKVASISHTYTYICPSCSGQTTTKPAICPSCEFKEDSEKKFAAKDVIIDEGKPFHFEAVIPKQKAGKFVMFTIYCTTEYGIESYCPSSLTNYYSYTVQ